MKKHCAIYFAFALALLFPALLPAQQKHALVIGNGAYTSITKLNNPVNDANDVAAALQNLGFTVEKVLDGTLDQIESAAVRLKNRLSVSKNSYGFFFYAGHGVQSNGENYLIPVDANIASENFLRRRAVSVQAVLGELKDAENELNIVVLDACRDNPFGWSRSGSRGLAVEPVQPGDSIIVYATSAGGTAADGAGRNGLFTTHLLTHLKTPGLEVKEVFNRTGADVLRASNRQQMPAVYNQFFGTAYLGVSPALAGTLPPAPAPVAVQPVTPPQPTSPPPQRPVPNNMARVKGGTFQMGSNNGSDDEKPVHSVTVNSFYIGKYPVTQKEWREVMGTNPSTHKGDNLPVENISWNDAVEYCNRRSRKEGLTPAYSGSEDSITCDWNAGGYRLPTEAEWEYAARGGNGSPGNYTYSGSNNIDSVAWHLGNSSGRTHPVGTKTANSLGIYDMSGNVKEWCWDWSRNWFLNSYPSGSQTDPRGEPSGSYRVLRGGCWYDTAANVRSATRRFESPSARNFGIGFRLVRLR